jgi:hypothetical protein
MFYVLQNESTADLRRVPILLTDAATGTTAQAGVALTNIYPYVNINGGAFIGGTGAVGEAGFGQYYYQMHPAETATLGLAGIHITAAGCRNYDAIAQIAAFNVYSAAGLGISAGDVWEYDISAISTAGLAGKQLNDAATGGSGISAYDVWSFDYLNAPGGVVPVSAAERLEETRTNTYTIDGNTTNISGQVWNEVLSMYSGTPDRAGGILYELGIGTTGTTSAEIWSYIDRTITGGTANTITGTVDISYPSMAGLANTIWSRDISGYVSPSAGFDLTQAASGGAGLTVGDVSDAVWNAQTGSYGASGSFGLGVLRSDNAGIAGSVTVWSGASYNGVFADAYRIDASYDAATALKNVLTGIGSSITGNITGDLSGSVGSVTADVNVSTASMAGVANTVWSTLTAPYTTHATFGHQVLRSDNAATIGEVTLHQSGGSKRVDADVHAFVNNTASATAMLNILTGIGASITSNITGNLSGSVGSVTNPVSVATASMTGIAGTVWNTDVSAFTSPSAGYDLTQASAGGGGITAYDVWNFDPTAMTVPQAGAILTDIQTDTNSIQTDISNIPNNVWVSDVSGYTNPGEAGFELTQAALGGGGVTAGDIWTYATRTITGGIADTVTTLTNGVTVTTNNDKTGYSLSGTQSFNLTGNITGSLSGSVGSVTGSVGSVVSAVSLSTATQASIANSVWLTDVTSYAAPSAGEDLATAAVGGISPADVWTYVNRTITGGIADTVTTLTNRAGFAITGGTITTVSDKTGYSLSSPQTFNLTGNITGNVSGSVGSVSGAVGSVSGSVGSVAGNVVGSVASVTNPVSISTASMGSIGSTVWNYVLSDAQTADTNLVSAGSGGVAITAGDVWSYNTRTLTSGAGITVIGAVQLVNGPYRLTSNQNNSDGILDILQNSVQEINLNLIDGNGAPASTAGYASIVNIFDVAGVAVTSYTPTVEYADGGILTFELDTDVTATIGRYNLIVGLSGAGFNVKYGPLQILVRPL